MNMNYREYVWKIYLILTWYSEKNNDKEWDKIEMDLIILMILDNIKKTKHKKKEKYKKLWWYIYNNISYPIIYMIDTWSNHNFTIAGILQFSQFPINEKNSNLFIKSERKRDAPFPRNFVVQLKCRIQPISQAYFQWSNMETHNEIAFPGQ